MWGNRSGLRGLWRLCWMCRARRPCARNAEGQFAMVAGMAMPVSLTGVKARPHEAWHDQAPAEPSTKTDHLDLPALWPRPFAGHTEAIGFHDGSVPSLQAAVRFGSGGKQAASARRYPFRESLANSSRILTSRFLRVAISNGKAPLCSSLRMLPASALIASFSVLAKCCFESR